MLYLAWKIATAPEPTARDTSVEPPHFVAGLALALANPKAYAAIGAVFSSVIVVANAPLSDAIVKTAVLGGMIVAIHAAWLSIGAGLARLALRPRTARVLNVAFAVLLVVSLAAAVLA